MTDPKQSPTVSHWLTKAAPDTDQDQLAAQMREALASPAATPFGVPPVTVPERNGEQLAQIMATHTAPHVQSSDDLVTTKPEQPNADLQLLAQREAGGPASRPGDVVPVSRRTT